MKKVRTPQIPLFIKTDKKKGLPPGALVHIGKKKTETVHIQCIEYDKDSCTESIIETVAKNADAKKGGQCWINIDGIHDTKAIEEAGKQFGLHALLMEDIMNTAQRPKVEDYGEHLFIVAKMLHVAPETQEISVEQISFVLLKDTLLTFQEKPQDSFADIRTRLLEGKGNIRKHAADYLLYRLLDAIVDEYFHVLGILSDRVEALEEELLERPDSEVLSAIHRLRRELVYIKQAVHPVRDLIATLDPEELELISDDTTPFFRDLLDHAVQTLATIETFRDMTSNMLDNYLSIASNKMNAVMKVLTIVATIFIPLTFISSIYGMNFRYMPELEWQIGYPLVLGFMFLTGIGMLAYFRKKHWL